MPTHPNHLSLDDPSIAGRYIDPWFPCEHPERPFSEEVIVDLACHKCRIAAEATIMQGTNPVGELDGIDLDIGGMAVVEALASLQAALDMTEAEY